MQISTIPYGQAYQKNEGEGLGIELIIELIQASLFAVPHSMKLVII